MNGKHDTSAGLAKPDGQNAVATSNPSWVFTQEWIVQSKEPVAKIFQSIDDLFDKYQIPRGMLAKLKLLQRFKRLDFLIDDSGSMLSPSDPFASRWAEVENRLLQMMELVQFVETGPIHISFFNHPDELVIERQEGQTPAEFLDVAKNAIRDKFRTVKPSGNTPLKRVLQQALRTNEPRAIYLMTDGVPSDGTINEISWMIQNRRNPQDTPIALLSCTDKTPEVEWLKRVEGKAPFVSELDDWETEQAEVRSGQGGWFPFTQGLWLICQLVAAMCPDDLDALDEGVPFTRKTLSELLGRMITDSEYQTYFRQHPGYAIYNSLADQFANGDVTAREILGTPIQSEAQLSQKYPYSYCRMWQSVRPQAMLADRIRVLLNDYTKGGSAWSRFLHGHWNRHHCQQVDKLIEDSYQWDGKTLFTELDKIKRRPGGSLDRRIAMIREIIYPEGVNQAAAPVSLR